MSPNFTIFYYHEIVVLFFFFNACGVGLQQAWAYSGFSVTCNDSGIHGRGCNCCLSATAERNPWIRAFHHSNRSCVCHAVHLRPNSSGPFPKPTQYIRKLSKRPHTFSLQISLPKKKNKKERKEKKKEPFLVIS